MAALDPADLIGSWSLVSVRIRFEDTGETVDLHGPEPRGVLVLTAGGRMVALLHGTRLPAAADEAGMAALLRDLSAYAGRYTLRGNRMENQVDIAWQPAWRGTAQPRNLRLEGDELELTTDVQDHPSLPGRRLRGIIRWRREAG